MAVPLPSLTNQSSSSATSGLSSTGDVFNFGLPQKPDYTSKILTGLAIAAAFYFVVKGRK